MSQKMLMEEKYRILRLASQTLKILAWVVLVVSIIVAIAGLVLIPTTGISRGLSVAGVALLYAILGFIYLYASSEAILVLLAIEANTRQIFELLSQREGQHE
jgi:hypothetical protein